MENLSKGKVYTACAHPDGTRGNPRAEMVRLRDVLRPMRLPVDVLVTSVEKIREWGDLPGTVLYEALHDGRFI